jgi:EAL domain-containing protein (putative c-di-GMP-specific phosphodiesterase class I)
MDRRLTEHQAMDLALRLAMERNELSLVYEPQCALESGEMVGVEAVPRWAHPDLGLVPPDRFIPAAEENGEIIAICRWMLRTACREAAAWPGQLRLAVRVSPLQFEFADVVEDVRQALAESGFAPHRLDLEIDEGTALSGASEVAETLHQLRRIGVGLVLEDFAKAQSPLRALGMHPVDKIRIDHSIVARLPADADTAVIIRTVTALSETHDKLVIASGVENADQAWMLGIMGCRVGQGPHFGRPRSGAEMARWLVDGVARRAVAD